MSCVGSELASLRRALQIRHVRIPRIALCTAAWDALHLGPGSRTLLAAMQQQSLGNEEETRGEEAEAGDGGKGF